MLFISRETTEFIDQVKKRKLEEVRCGKIRYDWLMNELVPWSRDVLVKARLAQEVSMDSLSAHKRPSLHHSLSNFSKYFNAQVLFVFLEHNNLCVL
jgi:hypothetical protein